ncbi:MAG: fatty acyl-AMP ligase [Myxococcota bacterium]|nr:fatty acyl-AMP ligase [Myxococcota bacterium]
MAVATFDSLEEAETLIEALQSLVETKPDDEALVLLDREAGEQRFTLGELWDRARSVQSTLMDRGLVPGSVVVLILPTSTDLIAAYFGVMLAGGIPAMLSTPSHRVSDPGIFCDRVAHVVANSSPHSVICRSDVAALFEGERAALLGEARLLRPDEIETPASFSASPPIDPETIATMQYSSGTTGTPKGVLVTHRAALNNLRSMQQGFEVSEDDVAVNWIPLYHDMGLFGAFLLPLLCGCKTVLIPTMDFMRDPAMWLRAIDRYRGTFAWAPNLAYALCAKRLGDEALEGLDLSSWRLALNASEPVLALTLAAFAERMAAYGFSPECMSPAYGLAEATVLATVHPVREEPLCEVLDRGLLATEEIARPTASAGVFCVSIGRAIPNCRLEIRDAAGRPLPERHVGKVWLHSNALFWGYHQNAELTSRVLVDGWLDTGDRGYLADDYLFFVARDKDLIVIGGEKYMPDDIEGAINRVPGVREGCAVAFGVMNPERGTEDLAAVVETRESGEAALADLERRIRAEVTAVTGLGLAQVILTPPGGVEKSTSGKLARGPTRRRYADVLGIEA